jgi:3-dehydroquinate synthase
MKIHSDVLQTVLQEAVQNKLQLVELDVSDTGKRQLLNFGHSFGHALETETQYETFLHGEAVAIGMVVAAKLSNQLGLCSLDDIKRLVALLSTCGLPIAAPKFSVEQYVAAMCRDKKVQDGVLRVVLNRGIGGYEMHSLTNPQQMLGF